jgi:hypothetical protein
LENKRALIPDENLLAGTTTTKPVGVILHPDFLNALSIWPELETIHRRKKNPYKITKEEMKSYWTSLGRQRRDEGFPLSEIVLSLCHIRRVLWEKVQSEGVLDTALDLYQAMDLHQRVILFFDRAMHNMALGYEEARREKGGSKRN